VGYQWGYKNSFPGTEAAYWNPEVTDHYSKGTIFNATGTSPCNGTGLQFEYGRLHFGLGNISTATGNVNTITNDYMLYSTANQHWPHWNLEQALYLSRWVGYEGHLKAYFGTPRGVIGPYNLYNSFTLPTWFASPSGGCTSAGCHWQIYQSQLYYGLLEYTIFGETVGIVLSAGSPSAPSTAGGADLGLHYVQGDPTCQTPGLNSKDCGVITWHDFIAHDTTASFPTGDQRTYQTTYLLGTPAQLADLGYTT
jgi:hypothetical protein